MFPLIPAARGPTLHAMGEAMSHTKISRAVGVIASGIALLAATASAGAQQTSSEEVPTFAKDVAPLFYKSCVSCHRPGEMGPMSLVTYQDARPWARAIRDRSSRDRCLPGLPILTTERSATIRALSQKISTRSSRGPTGGAPQGIARRYAEAARTHGRRLADWHARRRRRDAGGVPDSGGAGRSATEPTMSRRRSRRTCGLSPRKSARRIARTSITPS